MNILLELTTINYIIYHSLAKRLAEIYPGSKFAVILGAHGSDALKYLQEQRDIKYEFIYFHQELRKNAFESDIDYGELESFEKSLAPKSLWRLIAADRGLGYQFMHGVVFQKSFLSQSSTHENILRVFSGLLKQYRTIFHEYKTNIFLPAIAMGGIDVFIFEQICKEMKIPYIVPSNVRVKNLFAFSSDVQLRFSHIDDTCKALIEGRIVLDISKAEVLYNELIGELKDPQYFDRMNSRFNIVYFNSFLSKLKLMLAGVKSIMGELLGWYRTRKLRRSDDIRRQPNNISTLFSNISIGLRSLYQKYVLTNSKFSTPLKKDQKYIYYPLHINPEYSTQIQGTMWLDQSHLVELLAKSIPFDWKVLVKEHPGTLVARVRPLSFYKKLKKIPNVCIAPIGADMHQLISNAEMIAVITGTAGWEAILRGKPVITFADNMWDVLDLSRKCTNIETLSRDIYDEICRIKQISPAERKRRIVCLLASMLKHGFNISFPNQFVYTEMGTDEEYKVVGIETANALKKHIEYLKEEKGYKFC
ncbi:MAG: hypothetical protein HOI47_27530 [Candidatus Scalindua sp.]|jgi:hypothetical protein|nr:hypothetical protein [Candidatus Scalindua sp.]MBT6230414.1 hypothetical protein [Candidatus Scalindua sp.]